MNKLLDCLNNKNSSYIPIWFMRQAGRYLPEFREIRRENKDFVKLCLNSKLAKDVTLQPMKRFDLDAAIIFSDILMIPYGLGQSLEFKKGFGPSLGNLDFEKNIKVSTQNFVERLSPVYEAIKLTKKDIKDKSVIGFVGAPWTLLVYMLNKQSPKKDFNLNLLIKDQTLSRKLIEMLEEKVCLHAKKQIEAGADVIQIFDSWAGLLPEKELTNYCFSPTKKIVEYLKSFKIPVICFPKGIGKNYVNFCSAVKPDCISIDYETDPVWIKNNLKNITIQGGMDPKILLKGKEEIKKNVNNYLKIFSNQPYIFNLGHGVLPETNPEVIEYIIKIIRGK
tara:strand:- start:1227 stop:2231 length:1005 start_codon:yes stop_codon:yes gene_type:complete